MSDTLYKVIVAGRSCHGGDLAWSLPTPDGQGGYAPGDWHTVEGDDRDLQARTALDHRALPVVVAVGRRAVRGRGAGDRGLGRGQVRLPVGPSPPPGAASGLVGAGAAGRGGHLARAVADISRVPWFARRGPVDPAWHVFPSRAAAGAAARDAALYIVVCHVCADLPLDQAHRDHAAARWAVWQAGYGLFCDVGGVLYVYERP